MRVPRFTYGADGRCLAVPVADPGSISVRSYPAVERGPWVWISTGRDPDAADDTLIPWPGDLLEGGDMVTGYTLNPGNHGLVHDNLLDLTHLEYLHRIGESEFTESPSDTTAARRAARWLRGPVRGLRQGDRRQR